MINVSFYLSHVNCSIYCLVLKDVEGVWAMAIAVFLSHILYFTVTRPVF